MWISQRPDLTPEQKAQLIELDGEDSFYEFDDTSFDVLMEWARSRADRRASERTMVGAKNPRWFDEMVSGHAIENGETVP